MYRALALKAKRAGLGPNDHEQATELLHSTVIGFAPGEPQRVLLDGEDVTGEIRTLEVGELASALSTHSDLRKGMVARQQDIVGKGGVILEGRDATTVIAPHAQVKVYLTASLEERARRRTKELGTDEQFDEVRKQIQGRDYRDVTRDDSPLKVAEDAAVIESGGVPVEQVAAQIIALIPADLRN
jgi:cytidylate kinase